MVVAVFAGVLPRIADYGQAWLLVRALTGSETLVIAAVAAVNLISYAPLWMAALPGLALWRALLVDLASTAISNTVPIGFAFGLGTTAAMLHSFAFPPAAITRGVALTGIWNNLVKLAMPALALGGLVLVGDAPTGLAVAAVLGSAVLLLVVGILVATVTHRRRRRAVRRRRRATGVESRPGARPSCPDRLGDANRAVPGRLPRAAPPPLAAR